MIDIDPFDRTGTLLLATLVGSAIVMSLCIAARCRAEHVEARCVRPAASVLPADPRCGGGR